MAASSRKQPLTIMVAKVANADEAPIRLLVIKGRWRPKRDIKVRCIHKRADIGSHTTSVDAALCYHARDAQEGAGQNAISFRKRDTGSNAVSNPIQRAGADGK